MLFAYPMGLSHVNQMTFEVLMDNQGRVSW